MGEKGETIGFDDFLKVDIRVGTVVRAEPYPFGADAYVDLEVYLAWRGRGLPVETPAVRR